jgi:glycerate kinase
MRATTFGVGQLMAAAVSRGCRHLVVTVGGSATTDGGCGMAHALGARLLDARGRPIPPGGAGLPRLARMDACALKKLLERVRVTALTDVRNPLLGPRGAARLVGPQKGATPAQVRLLEKGLANFARVCRRDLGVNVARIPGAGAAGGLGAGLIAFTGARLESGADWIFRSLRFDACLKRADLILTGEGSLDAQTPCGKLVSRVAARARRARVPVIAFAGRVSLSPRAIRKMGLLAAYPVSGRGISLRESFRRAAQLLEHRVARALTAGLHGGHGGRPE